MNWIKLHSTHSSHEIFVDITQVRAMYRNQMVPPLHYVNLSSSGMTAPTPPPTYTTVLMYRKDDILEVQETPEEILRLAKGVKPQANAFSLEELEAAQNQINNGNNHMTWTQMWSKPFEPQQE